MKFAVVFATALLAVVSAAPACDIGKLATVAGGANAKKCEADSGYKLVPPTKPSAEVVAKMCKSSACTALLGELTAAAPTECTITLGTPIDLYAGLLTPIKKTCDASATTPVPAPVTEAPGPATVAPGPATPTVAPVTPAPVTPKPAC